MSVWRSFIRFSDRFFYILCFYSYFCRNTILIRLYMKILVVEDDKDLREICGVASSRLPDGINEGW